MKKMSLSAKIFLVIIAAVISFLLIFLSIKTFRNQLDDSLKKTTYSVLSETSRLHKDVINSKIDAKFQVLEITALDMSNNMFSDQEHMDMLCTELEENEFFGKVYAADVFGEILNSSNNINISEYSYFKNALRGERTIENPYKTPFIDKLGYSVFIMSVPIKVDNEVIGVLLGMYDQTALGDVLLSQNFNGCEHMMLVDDGGNVIFSKGNQKNLDTKLFDFYKDVELRDGITYSELKEEFNSTGKFAISYTVKSRENQKSVFYSICTALGYNKWFIISTVLSDIVNSEYSFINHHVFQLTMSIFGIVSFLILIIIVMVQTDKKSLEFEKNLLTLNEERCRIVFENSGSAVFEIDEDNTVVSCNDVFKMMFGRDIEIDNDIMSARYVYKDDINKIKDIAAKIKRGLSKTVTELRIKNSDGKYMWYRLYLNIIRQEKKYSFRLIGSIVDIDKDRKSLEEFENKSKKDLFTSCYNKITTEYLCEELINLSTEGTITAMFMIDFDNFKGINDNYGHSVGDDVLIALSKSLLESFTEDDVVGRIGGDEFLVFIPNAISEKNVKNMLEILFEKARNTKIIDNVYLTISCGVYITDQKLTFEQMYIISDKNLYKAKSSGKNKYILETYIQNKEKII